MSSQFWLDSQILKKYIEEEKRKRKERLEEREKWKKFEERLKEFFSPPFKKSSLTDVSEKRKLFVFVEYDRSGVTGFGYLCGIDNYGKKWGSIFRFPTSLEYNVFIEDAILYVYNVNIEKLDSCTRQGEILFCCEEPLGENINWEEVDDIVINNTWIISIAPLYLYKSEDNSLWIRTQGEMRVEYRDRPVAVSPVIKSARGLLQGRVYYTILLPPGTYRVYVPNPTANFERKLFLKKKRKKKR